MGAHYSCSKCSRVFYAPTGCIYDNLIDFSYKLWCKYCNDDMYHIRISKGKYEYQLKTYPVANKDEIVKRNERLF
jgi:DNA-directed RNA polymerase subunit RPC12/RpoP